MSKLLPLDLKQFVKTGEDKGMTTLKHKAGHEIKIAHQALSPEIQKQLKSLPLYNGGMVDKFADGGELDDAGSKPQMKREEGSRFAQSSADNDETHVIVPMTRAHANGRLAKAMLNNYGNGGEVDKDDQMKREETKRFSQSFKDADEAHAVVPMTRPEANKRMQNIPALAKGGRVANYDEGTTSLGGVQQSDIDQPNSSSMAQPNSSFMTDDPTAGIPKATPQEMTLDSYKQRLSETDPVKYQYNPESLDRDAQDLAVNKLQSQENIKQGQQAYADQQQQSKEAEDVAYNEQASKLGLPLRPAPMPAAPASTTTDQPPGATPPNPNAPPPQTGGNPVEKARDLLSEGFKNAEAGEYNTGQAQQAQDKARAVSAELSAYHAQNAIDHYNDVSSTILDDNNKVAQDIANQHLDYNRYLGNMSTGSKIATGIGLMLSGIGSGLTGQPNLAYEMLQKNINRDVEMQKDQLGQKKTLLEANLKKFGNLTTAMDVTRSQMNAIAGYKMQQAISDSQGKIDTSTAQKNLGLIQQQEYTTARSAAMYSTMQNMMGGNNGTVFQSPQAEMAHRVSMMSDPAKGLSDLASKQVLGPDGRQYVIENEEARKSFQTKKTGIDDASQVIDNINRIAKMPLSDRIKNYPALKGEFDSLKDKLTFAAKDDANLGRVAQQELPLLQKMAGDPKYFDPTNANKALNRIKANMNKSLESHLVSIFGDRARSAPVVTKEIGK